MGDPERDAYHSKWFNLEHDLINRDVASKMICFIHSEAIAPLWKLAKAKKYEWKNGWIFLHRSKGIKIVGFSYGEKLTFFVDHKIARYAEFPKHKTTQLSVLTLDVPRFEMDYNESADDNIIYDHDRLLEKTFKDACTWIVKQISTEFGRISGRTKFNDRYLRPLINGRDLLGEECFCYDDLKAEYISDFWWAMWCLQLIKFYEPVGDPTK
jgi:hypothetical protein